MESLYWHLQQKAKKFVKLLTELGESNDLRDLTYCPVKKQNRNVYFIGKTLAFISIKYFKNYL